MKNVDKLIFDLEVSLLTPAVRASVEKLNVLLADDFREFGSSGEIYSKQDILEQLPKATQIARVEFSVSDFQVQQLAEDMEKNRQKLADGISSSNAEKELNFD